MKRSRTPGRETPKRRRKMRSCYSASPQNLKFASKSSANIREQQVKKSSAALLQDVTTTRGGKMQQRAENDLLGPTPLPPAPPAPPPAPPAPPAHPAHPAHPAPPRSKPLEASPVFTKTSTSEKKSAESESEPPGSDVDDDDDDDVDDVDDDVDKEKVGADDELIDAVIQRRRRRRRQRRRRRWLGEEGLACEEAEAIHEPTRPEMVQVEVKERRPEMVQVEAKERRPEMVQVEAKEREVSNHATDMPVQSQSQSGNEAGESSRSQSNDHALDSGCEASRTDGAQVTEPHRQGSGASADDAMDVDACPSSRQTQQGNKRWVDRQQDCRATPSDAEMAQQEKKPTSVVSTGWLLEKLRGLSAETLESGRAEMERELARMEAETEKLPRADMSSPRGGGNAAQRLLLMENLVGRKLVSRIPGATWARYRKRLLRMCRSAAVLNMDFRQRLAKVKEIVYMPEEMELLRRGDEARMACAIRLCATVTEITGRDDEVVPEAEMGAWVDVEIRDTAWKVKTTAVWRKYWPEVGREVESMVID